MSRKALTKEEKEIADSFAHGKFKKKQDSRDFTKMARDTKEARINLRLQENVLKFFQDLSEKEGVPYQTLINSALFKVASGQLVESDIANLSDELREIKKELSAIKLKKRA